MEGDEGREIETLNSCLMYLTEGHLWLFCFTYSFYCPFGYYQEVVNFHSQAWVTEVQSLRGGDTLQDGTLHAGDRNSH